MEELAKLEAERGKPEYLPDNAGIKGSKAAKSGQLAVGMKRRSGRHRKRCAIF